QGHLGALLEHGVNLGDAMMIVATLAYAVYSVLLKKWSLKLPAMQLLYLQVLVAILALLPLYLLSPRTGLNAANLPLVLYAALFASIVAALAWMHGVARLGPSRMALFFNLLPIITACIATLVLGERLTVHHLVGGALTLAGVLLAEFWQRRPARLRSATC
ncbi:DMT family transporter, partial [Pseudomonas aeruginosa]